MSALIVPVALLFIVGLVSGFILLCIRYGEKKATEKAARDVQEILAKQRDAVDYPISGDNILDRMRDGSF